MSWIKYSLVRVVSNWPLGLWARSFSNGYNPTQMFFILRFLARYRMIYLLNIVLQGAIVLRILGAIAKWCVCVVTMCVVHIDFRDKLSQTLLNPLWVSQGKKYILGPQNWTVCTTIRSILRSQPRIEYKTPWSEIGQLDHSDTPPGKTLG